MKTSTLVLSALAAALGLGACSKKSSDLVVIAHVGPVTGPSAHLGRDNELGAQMAVDEINAKGLVLGGKKVTLELAREDDASDPKQGSAVAQKLVDAGVKGVIGHLNSGTTIPASRLYSDAGIPQISPSTTQPLYTRQGFKTAFRVVADDVQLGGVLARYSTGQLKGKTMAVIDDRTAYGQGVAEEFAKAAEKSGARVVNRQFTTDRATDFSAILTAVKAARPDIIFFGGMDSVAGPMLRQMKQLGMSTKFLGGDGLCTADLPHFSGDSVADDQVICAEAGGVDGQEKVAMDDFRKKFQAKFNTDVKLYAPYVYDAVQVMVAAMVKADSSEPAKYLPELAKTENHAGVTGNISFDEKGDLKNGAVTLYTYREGKRNQIALMR